MPDIDLRDYAVKFPETRDLFQFLSRTQGDIKIVLAFLEDLTRDYRRRATLTDEDIPLRHFRTEEYEGNQTEPLQAADRDHISIMLEARQGSPTALQIAAATTAELVWPLMGFPEGMDVFDFIEHNSYFCEDAWLDEFEAFMNAAFDCLYDHAFHHKDEKFVTQSFFSAAAIQRTSSDKQDRLQSTFDGFLLSAIDFVVWMHKNRSSFEDEV